MRKSITILLLFSMLLLQYSRQMAYLQCKVSKSLTSKHCNCEKIVMAEDSQGSHDEPLTSGAKGHAPDDLFFIYHLTADFKLCSPFEKKPTAFNKFLIQDSFEGKLFQPPRI